jgi:hypothetical protein
MCVTFPPFFMRILLRTMTIGNTRGYIQMRVTFPPFFCALAAHNAIRPLIIQEAKFRCASLSRLSSAHFAAHNDNTQLLIQEAKFRCASLSRLFSAQLAAKATTNKRGKIQVRVTFPPFFCAACRAQWRDA